MRKSNHNAANTVAPLPLGGDGGDGPHPFFRGLRDGIPIAMGYYAVAFSLGIIAAGAGLTALTGFVSSLLIRASAGEYGVYSLAAIGASYAEIVGVSLIANLRYLLMGAALTQKFSAATSLPKRIAAAWCITDEVFGISMAYPGKLPVSYPLGATLIAGLSWAAGTTSGILAGGALPQPVVAALSVSLYGMFIAIVVPPAQKDKAVGLAVLVSVALSGLTALLPWFEALSAGTRTIILTILISALAAWLKPVKDEEEDSLAGKADMAPATQEKGGEA